MPEAAPVISATLPRILPAMTLLAAEDTIGCSTTPEGAVMDFEYSKKTKMYMEQLTDFMSKFVYPNEATCRDQLDGQADRWSVPPVMEELKTRARERGLWNLFLPESERGAGLTNLDYAPLCEIMGRSPIAPEVFNCSAPDTGNMEVLERYGTPEQKKRWLEPLLDGKIRSAFAMTEPKVASSDATNIESSIVRDGDAYVINGHKWWTSGIGDKRCQVLIFMGKTDAKNPDRYKQQSMILVPRDTPGNKAARQAIAEIKVAVPNMTLRVLDRAMQLHGGGGVSQEFPLAFWWAHSRTLRFADGPDEVHRRQIGRLELRKHS